MFSVTFLLLGMLFTVRGSGAQSVTQPEAHVTVSEGKFLELKCNYSYSWNTILFWYVKYPNKELQFILQYLSGNTVVKGINGFEAKHEKEKTSFHLKKPLAHWSDSAQYFCALDDTVPMAAGGAEHKPPGPQGFSEIQEKSLTCF